MSVATNGDESKAYAVTAPQYTNLDGPANATLPVWFWPATVKTSSGVRPASHTGIAYCMNSGVAALEGKTVVGFYNAADLQGYFC